MTSKRVLSLVSQWLADRSQVICAFGHLIVFLSLLKHNYHEVNMNIYIGNLDYGVSEEDLREAFGEFGEVSSANIISDKFTGRSKGFGFVEMPNDAEANQAIDALNDTDLNGRSIKVNQARPREERPSRPRY